jgi:hypothetical protein
MCWEIETGSDMVHNRPRQRLNLSKSIFDVFFCKLGFRELATTEWALYILASK